MQINRIQNNNQNFGLKVGPIANELLYSANHIAYKLKHEATLKNIAFLRGLSDDLKLIAQREGKNDNYVFYFGKQNLNNSAAKKITLDNPNENPVNIINEVAEKIKTIVNFKN